MGTDGGSSDGLARRVGVGAGPFHFLGQPLLIVILILLLISFVQPAGRIGFWQTSRFFMVEQAIHSGYD